MKLVLISLLVLGGCSTTVRQPYDINTEYLRGMDLKVSARNIKGDEISETKFRGVGVVPPAYSYVIEGKIKSDADFFLWQTCHQQHPKEKLGDDFELTWTPTMDDMACGSVLELRSTERKHTRNQGAYMIVDDPHKYTLRSRLNCNGSPLGQKTGLVACHAKENLNTSIHFDEEVFLAPNPGRCLLPQGWLGKSLSFQMPKQTCAMQFNAVSKRSSQMVLLFPYKDITLTGESD